MARFNPHHDNSKLYPAMHEFAMECLMRDGSMLQPGQTLWTPENLDELDRTFVQNPDAGGDDYYKKLKNQVNSGSTNSRKLMAELHWLLFVFPSDMLARTKEQRIKEIWSWSGESLPSGVLFLDYNILEGLGHTGQKNHRWRELSFLIRFLQRWKKMPLAQREDALAQPEQFTAFLDDTPGVAGRQLRHILPHLLFPDEFERISSPRHKREILEGFGVAPRHEVNKMDTASLDVAIFNLRKKLETEHGREIDFYEPDIESNWRDRGATYLISWNPTRWEWPSFAEDRVVTIEGRTVTHRWRTSSKQPKVDDCVYLLRTGKEPRGIIARGRVAKAPYPDTHWDEAKAQNGETTDFIEVEFEDIRDPALDAFVPLELLVTQITGQDWSPQSSGIVIKPDAVRALDRLWEAAETAEPEVDTIEKAASAMAKNLILYGPPGTGKTYSSAAEAVRLCGELVPTDRDALMEVYDRLLAAGRIEFVTFHQSMAYEDFVEGRQPMTGTEDEEGAVSTGFRLETVPGTFRRIAKRAEVAWAKHNGALSVDSGDAQGGSHSDELTLADPECDLEELPETSGIKVTTGNFASDQRFTVSDLPPVREGTFRDLAQQAARVLSNRHPEGFTLQDFDEHFAQMGEDNGMEPKGGWETQRYARWMAHPDQKWLVPVASGADLVAAKNGSVERGIPQVSSRYSVAPSFVLIIDEINRANISKVFGELITLLEPDKRLGQPNQIKVRLPYSGDEFGVPSNLQILGTMNTADRSIALLDTALRRRFSFRELMPDPAVLKDAAERTEINLSMLLTTINDRIEYLYDREHQIGHAYFTGCETRGDVDEVMRHKVIPLLAEYFFEDWARIAAVLGDLETHDRDISGGFLNRSALKAPPGLDNGEALPRFRWTVRSVDEGFSYTRLLVQ